MSKLILQRESLLKLQSKGILSSTLVDTVWEELEQECPPLKSEAQNSQENIATAHVVIPPLQKNFRQSIEPIDITIAFSFANGFHLASFISRIKNRLEEDQFKIAFVNDTSKLDLIEAEKRVASSTALLVLLTADCLKQTEVVFAMSAAHYYYKHASLVILVHDASSCFFPGYEEHPPSLRTLFSEKAVTFLPCFQEDGLLQVIEKYQSEKKILDNVIKTETSIALSIYNRITSKHGNVTLTKLREILIASSTMENSATPQSEIEDIDELLKSIDKDSDTLIDSNEFCTAYLYNEKFEKRMIKLRQTVLPSDHGSQVTEDVHTRLFLSHKRSTGQGIAGRLYEGLKKDYVVFLDSEAKFKIHNLKQIVENTDVFIFILSPGIFQSPWCLQELQSAVANNKKIVVVRDLHYDLPAELPEQWRPFETIFRQNSLIWMAEYNLQCISALKSEIGPSDSMIDHILDILSENLTSIKNTGTLKLSRNMKPGSFAALLWILNENSISNGHNGHLAAAIRARTDKDMSVLQALSTCYLSDIKTIDATHYKITDLDIFKYTPSLTSYSHQFKDVDLVLKKVKLSSPRNFREFFSNNFGHSIKNLKVLQAIPLVAAPPAEQSRAKVTTTVQGPGEGLPPPPPPTGAPAPPPSPPGLSAPPPLPGAKPLSTNVSHTTQPQFVFKESSLSVITDAIILAISPFLNNLKSLIIEHTRLTDAGWAVLVKSSPRLEHLEVLIAEEVTDNGVRLTPDFLHDLKTLVLPVDNTNITKDVLIQIVAKLKKLETLQTIPVAKDTTFIKFSENWKKISSASLGWIGEYLSLTHIDASDCQIAADLSKLLKNAKSLKILNLSKTDLKDAILEHLLLAPNLEKLDLSRTAVTKNSIVHLTKLTGLKSINLSECNIGDETVQKLVTLPLEELFLAQCEAITNNSLEAISKNVPGIKKLILNGCSRISNPGLTALSQTCHNLQQLELSECYHIGLEGIEKIASNCKKISHLNLECCYLIGDVEVEAIAKNFGASLIDLNLGFCKKIRNDGLKHLGEYCKNLQHLNLTRCSEVTEVGFQYLESSLSNLRSVNLSRTYLTTDKAVSAAIKDCRNLNSIDLSFCRNFRGDAVAQLGSCPELTTLICSENSKLQSQGFAGLQGCQKLQTLRLSRTNASDSAIELMGPHPSLTELDLVDTQITDKGLKAIAQFFPNLKKLSLNGNQRITSEGVIAITQGCPNIEELYLLTCDMAVNDDTIYHIAKNLQKLTILNLPGKNVTEKGLEHIVNYCYAITAFRIAECEFFAPIAKFADRLTALTFFKCPQLSDVDFVQIAPKTGNLTILRLTECEQITDKAIVALEKYCHKLQTVNLFDCKAITDKSLISLAKHNTGITQIQLKGCKKITHKGIQAIVEKNKLVFLDMEDCEKTNDFCLDLIAKKCPALKTFRLNKCREITERGLKSIALGCKKLEAMSLQYNLKLTDEATDHITANLTNLKYLSLAQCPKITDASLDFIGSRCPGLQRLVLDDAAVTDEGVQKFAEKNVCEGLRYLSLDDCLKLTAQTMSSKFVAGLSDVSEFLGQFRPLV